MMAKVEHRKKCVRLFYGKNMIYEILEHFNFIHYAIARRMRSAHTDTQKHMRTGLVTMCQLSQRSKSV